MIDLNLTELIAHPALLEAPKAAAAESGLLCDFFRACSDCRSSVLNDGLGRVTHDPVSLARIWVLDILRLLLQIIRLTHWHCCTEYELHTVSH